MPSGIKGFQKGHKTGFFGKKHSEETKRKMSKSHKNPSQETRKKMSKAHKGIPLPYAKGRSGWSKGLTKKTDKRLDYERPTTFKKGNKPTNGFKKGCPSYWSGKRGSKHPNWKGGKFKRANRWHIWTFNGLKVKYVAQSRFIVEKILKRHLKAKEAIHHINEIKDDDRPENLLGFANRSAHIKFHHNPNNVKSEEIIFDGRKFIQ